jgi:hypothetical protein
MTNESMTEKKSPAKGTPTLQAALLLLVIGVVLAVAGGSGIAWVFIAGGLICGVVGLIQKDSAPR